MNVTDLKSLLLSFYHFADNFAQLFELPSENLVTSLQGTTVIRNSSQTPIAAYMGHERRSNSSELPCFL